MIVREVVSRFQKLSCELIESDQQGKKRGGQKKKKTARRHEFGNTSKIWTQFRCTKQDKPHSEDA